MKTKEIKKGELLTVITDDMQLEDDVRIIMVGQPNVADLGGMESILTMEMHHVEEHPFGADLKEKYGVDLVHYTVRSEKVTNINLEDEDMVVINMDIEIPKVRSTRKVNPLEIPYFDKEEAEAIANALNEKALKKIEDVQQLVAKIHANMEDIVKNKRN